MNHFWWVKVPAGARRIWPVLGPILADGRYLAAWPTLGAWAPVAALGLGAFLGGVS